MTFVRREVRGPFLLALVVLLASGCAGGSHYVLHAPSGPDRSYVAEGVASWYGPGFHGKKTASGVRFNQHDLTCAHRTLPFGTRLKVTNLSNGEQLVVTVNDRGPYVRSRIVDLSREAARRLDILPTGIARVRLETVSPDEVASDEVASGSPVGLSGADPE